MAVERYKVGRKYTERHRVDISFDSLSSKEESKALSAAMRELAKAATLEGRTEPARRWAVATLERVGMPLDPNAPIYSERNWRRENERSSAEWYAIQILQTTSWLFTFVERGDARMAADFALDLGVLVTEAKIAFDYMAGNAALGGHGAKESDARRQLEQQREIWRSKANEYWRKRPQLTKTAVASKIDPDPSRRRTIIRAIRDLKPTR